MGVQFQVVIDTHDPAGLADFWANALGYVVQPPPEGYDTWERWFLASGVPESEWNAVRAIVDPDRRGPRVCFARVPEPKTGKNRVHLDINAGGGSDVAPGERRRLVDAEAERLRGIGASHAWTTDEDGEYTVTLRDPEGNEFCIE